MRIGIDARELCGRPTGLGRYLSGLLTAWSAAERAREHEFLLYAPAPLAKSVEGLDARRFQVRLVAGAAGTWWEQVELPRALAPDRLDLLFSPGYTVPLYRSLASVVTIHDVSFAAHPEWFGSREGLRRRWLTAQSAAQAQAIIAVSQFSRREIVERLGIDASKIRVIYSGVDLPPRPASGEANPRVLFVGSIFNRRHVPRLLTAFRALARVHPDVTLDIVGDNRTHPYEDIESLVARAGLNGRARWRSYVSDDQLEQLYREARAFAFLSEYEGFGLTPLEALAAGVPSVLLDTAVAREICGEAALYVPPGDDASPVTGALERLLYDEQTRRRLLSAAPGLLARYTWSRAADETLSVFEAL